MAGDSDWLLLTSWTSLIPNNNWNFVLLHPPIFKLHSKGSNGSVEIVSPFQYPSNIVQRLSIGDVECLYFGLVSLPILCHDANFSFQLPDFDFARRELLDPIQDQTMPDQVKEGHVGDARLIPGPEATMAAFA